MTDPLHVIADRLRTRLAADRCTMYIVDRESQAVRSSVALGLEIPEIRLPMNRGLVGYVARTGRTVNLRDAYNDPRFDRSVDQQTGYRTKTILTMAIRDRHHEVIGVLQVLNKTDGRFTDDDEQIMQDHCGELAALLAGDVP